MSDCRYIPASSIGKSAPVVAVKGKWPGWAEAVIT
jgi:hypothetical protein